MTTTGSKIGLSAVALGLAWAVAACGSETSTENRRSAASTESAQPTTTARDVLEGFKLLSYDFTPIGSIEELAATADLIVSGSITEVTSGRLSGDPGDSFAARYSAISVRVDQAVTGDATAGEAVWVEIPTNPDVLGDGLQPGLRVALYLKASQPNSAAEPFSDRGSAVPAGEQLWALSHPQGLVVQYGESTGTVAPLSEQVDTNGSVDDLIEETETVF